MPRVIRNPYCHQYTKQLPNLGYENPGGKAVAKQLFAENRLTTGLVLGAMQLGIYGACLWKLHKDICGQDIAATHRLLQTLVASKDPGSIEFYSPSEERIVNVMEYVRRTDP
jgi:hypothetical protein